MIASRVMLPVTIAILDPLVQPLDLVAGKETSSAPEEAKEGEPFAPPARETVRQPPGRRELRRRIPRLSAGPLPQ
jgi:hypothetical protein